MPLNCLKHVLPHPTLLRRFCYIELLNRARPDIVHDPMHLEPALVLGIHHDRILAQQPHTLAYIQLGQRLGLAAALQSGGLLGGSIDFEVGRVARAQSAQRLQPRVKHAAELAAAEGAGDAAAACMAGQHDVGDVQVRDRVGEHSGQGEVGGGDDVGDVAVDEDVSGG